MPVVPDPSPLAFPCEFPIKVMGRKQPGFAQAVTFADDTLRRGKVNTAGWQVLSVERSDSEMLRNRRTTA